MQLASPSAPQIDQLSDQVTRPLWSVMIPTYNCARLLKQTLESVLAQDPGVDRMQIEVVDDCSTLDDPLAVVNEIGKGRVGFYRREANGGATANFNSCLQRSRGHLVHLLHGDDWVLPGFYEQIDKLAEARSDCALIATRCFFVDEEGVILGVTPRLPKLEQASTNVEDFFYTTPIQAPGVVVRRSFYEQHGGVLPQLVHTADCEMWARAVSKGGGLVCRDVLACYRTFTSNDSGRLMRTAENLRDIERLNVLFAERFNGFDANRGKERICVVALAQAELFAKKGEREAERANRAFYRSKAPWRLRLRHYARQVLRSMSHLALG